MAKIQKGGDALARGGKALMGIMTIVGRIAFILFVLILFVMFLGLGVSLIMMIFSPNGSPHLIDGMKDATEMLVIHQDPGYKGAVPVLRSNDQREGMEFTWSVWLYVKNLNDNQGQMKHIFHKGNNKLNFDAGSDVPRGMNYPNNGPGLYLTSDTNELVVVMNTFDEIIEEIRVSNLPMKKWVNVMIRCEGSTIDVYINGNIAKRHVLQSVPKQNYGDVYVNANNGYNGNLSDLWYFDKALGLSKIQSIVEKGPNLKLAGKSAVSESHPPYLSLRWYLMGTK